jgi:hypothetical protein
VKGHIEENLMDGLLELVDKLYHPFIFKRCNLMGHMLKKVMKYFTHTRLYNFFTTTFNWWL